MMMFDNFRTQFEVYYNYQTMSYIAVVLDLSLILVFDIQELIQAMMSSLMKLKPKIC